MDILVGGDNLGSTDFSRFTATRRLVAVLVDALSKSSNPDTPTACRDAQRATYPRDGGGKSRLSRGDERHFPEVRHDDGRYRIRSWTVQQQSGNVHLRAQKVPPDARSRRNSETGRLQLDREYAKDLEMLFGRYQRVRKPTRKVTNSQWHPLRH